MSPLRIAVTSGYASSKHAIALLHRLSAQPNLQVVLCAEVKTFSVRRIRQLLRMYGPRDAWNKFRNIFFPSPENLFAEETAYIEKYLKHYSIGSRSTAEASGHLGIAHVRAKSLNDAALVKKIRDSQIDLLVYAGGGILKRELIAAPRLGVLNGHSGPLPFFRGMNCLEWTLLYGVAPELSVHLIDKGIDTGPILARFPLDVRDAEKIATLRGKSVVAEVEALCAVAADFEKYSGARIVQAPAQGCQFFTMHPLLKKELERKLARKNLVLTDAATFMSKRPTA